jgi:hypothetical protein
MAKQQFPRLATRIAELQANNYEIVMATEFNMRDTQYLLGQSPAWVRRQVTGYAGKDKARKPSIKAHKTELGWRIGAEAIEEKLCELAEKDALAQARRANPASFPNYRNGGARALNQVKREAAEKLSEEDQAALAALLKKMAAVTE